MLPIIAAESACKRCSAARRDLSPVHMRCVVLERIQLARNAQLACINAPARDEEKRCIEAYSWRGLVVGERTLSASGAAASSVSSAAASLTCHSNAKRNS